MAQPRIELQGQSTSTANPHRLFSLAVTGVGCNASGGNAFWWHTVVFEQNSTGSTCSLKSGWPVTWPRPQRGHVQ